MIKRLNERWEQQEIMGYACYCYLPDNTDWWSLDEMADLYGVSLRDMRINIRRGLEPTVTHGPPPKPLKPKKIQPTYKVKAEGKLIGTDMNGERIGSKAAQVFASLSFGGGCG